MREKIKERKNSEKAVASVIHFWVCRWRVPALITHYLFKAQGVRDQKANEMVQVLILKMTKITWQVGIKT